MGGKPFAKISGEAVVLFDGGHGSDAGEEGVGQDAEAGADLDDGVAGLQFRGGEQDIQDIAVDEKILAEEARGVEIELRQQGANFRGARQIGERGPCARGRNDPVMLSGGAWRRSRNISAWSGSRASRRSRDPSTSSG